MKCDSESQPYLARLPTPCSTALLGLGGEMSSSTPAAPQQGLRSARTHTLDLTWKKGGWRWLHKGMALGMHEDGRVKRPKREQEHTKLLHGPVKTPRKLFQMKFHHAYQEPIIVLLIEGLQQHPG